MSGTTQRPEMTLSQSRAGAFTLAFVSFIVTVAIVLGTVVDMRRAFLLPSSAYSKLGAPSAFLRFTPYHLIILVLGLLSAWVAFRLMRQAERTLLIDFSRWRTALTSILMVLLIVDLFIYRGVQADRVATAGKLGISKTFNLDALPTWLRPLGEAANFMLVVWHATFLGILIGALFLTLLFSSERLKGIFGLRGLRAHLLGSASALAYPFCSCCAGPLGASLYRGGASLDTTLAFVVAAPLLNITTLLLAVTLLPAEYALLRIAGGVLIAVFGTWLVVRAVRGYVLVAAPPPQTPVLRFFEALTRPFTFEQVLAGRPLTTPSELVSAWLRTAWRLALVAVPTLFIAATVVGWIGPIVFSLTGGNSFAAVLLASALGVFIMIPTWTELAVAIPLLNEGLTGPAAALLLSLPATSVPSLVIFGSALRSWRVPLLLLLVVFVVSVIAGIVFL